MEHLEKYTFSIFQEDIIVLTETFSTKPIHMDNYYSIHNLASQGTTGRPSRGISCLITPQLAPFQVAHKTKRSSSSRTSEHNFYCHQHQL
jgi:hypothetical protein